MNVVAGKVSRTGWNRVALQILNQAKVVVRESALMRHDWTKVVEVKLAFGVKPTMKDGRSSQSQVDVNHQW